MMKSSRTWLMVLTLALLSAQVNRVVAEDKDAKVDAEKTDAARAALEKAFSETLTGATLVGRFSVDGRNAEKPPQPERYELESVTKLSGDYWVFLARIKYGNNDVKVPITLKVLWAGDTPVASLTNLAIPGLGTFTARVLFHGDRYVGTWQHGKVGGHMWGSIEKAAAQKDSKDKNESSKK